MTTATRPLRIIYLDDDKESHEVVDRFFKQDEGLRIRHIYTVGEFMAQVENYHYDVALVDQVLKESSEKSLAGTTIVKLIESKINGTKVIILTSFDKSSVQREIDKFDIKKIVAVIGKDELLSLKRIFDSWTLKS